MKREEDARKPVSVIRTLTEFTPLGMASALAAIARRSSGHAPAAKDRPGPDAGLCWCPCGAS